MHCLLGQEYKDYAYLAGGDRIGGGGEKSKCLFLLPHVYCLTRQGNLNSSFL